MPRKLQTSVTQTLGDTAQLQWSGERATPHAAQRGCPGPGAVAGLVRGNTQASTQEAHLTRSEPSHTDAPATPRWNGTLVLTLPATVPQGPKSMARTHAAPLAARATTRPAERARSPRAWAWAGLLLGLLATLAHQALAHWLAQALAQASGGRIHLVQARGTVWNGSAQWVPAALLAKTAPPCRAG